MNETQTMTLTDFLLARIAEDENAAREAIRRVAPCGRCPLYGQPARVLAECEAKRRIVGMAYWDLGGRGVDAVLATLATVYDRHPDYRKEWRS